MSPSAARCQPKGEHRTIWHLTWLSGSYYDDTEADIKQTDFSMTEYPSRFGEKQAI